MFTFSVVGSYGHIVSMIREMRLPFGLISENQILTNIDIILFDQLSRFYYECIEDTKTFSIDFDKVQNIIERNPKLERNRKLFARNAYEEDVTATRDICFNECRGKI